MAELFQNHAPLSDSLRTLGRPRANQGLAPAAGHEFCDSGEVVEPVVPEPSSAAEGLRPGVPPGERRKHEDGPEGAGDQEIGLQAPGGPLTAHQGSAEPAVAGAVDMDEVASEEAFEEGSDVDSGETSGPPVKRKPR